ncbi:hypothetical protein L3Q82_026619 [Scortum barcoo]|uniref:Uncharacterized protein n=1 Tax=Scortum barcoo TaxID=214431 RepID=A0ACB8WJ73_9TELE|nr:hypothetical protein L3Q82_026619 [Scortum barcoo]
MMDELVQDLVSALEQTSEQSKLGELWEEMVLSPLQQRRQIRRRRGRKRCRESSLYPHLQHRRCWIEASESSLDETIGYRQPSTIAASVANCSDSDDMTSSNRWRSVMRGPVRRRHPSWPESDSFTENNPGRPLRRRRKVKRMTADVTVRLQQKLKVSGVDRKQRHRPSRMQHLPGPKKRSGTWVGAERQTEGARLMGKERWKRKMAKEHRDATDENMSEGPGSACWQSGHLAPRLAQQAGLTCGVDAVPGSASVSSCAAAPAAAAGGDVDFKPCHQKNKATNGSSRRALCLCPLLMLDHRVPQMPADVSRGGTQLSRGLGNQSGEWAGRGRRDGPGQLGQARHLPDSPERPAPSRICFWWMCGEMMQDHLAGKTSRLGGRFSDPLVTGRPLQYGKAPYQRISDPPALSYKQGDDEQSDWFFEGDCGVGTGVAGLLPGWDSEGQLSLEDNHPSPTFLQPTRLSQRGCRYHSRLKRVPGSAACCIRKNRRRLPSKGNSVPVFVERLRHFSQDPYQRDFWLPSVGKRDLSQLNPLCPLPVCPIDMVSESSCLRCSSSICRNRQTNVTPGLLCTGDVRRRREAAAVSLTTSASNPFHKDHQREEAQGAGNTSAPETVGSGAPGSLSSTSAQPESLSFLRGGP